jgi:hypothetical protein
MPLESTPDSAEIGNRQSEVDNSFLPLIEQTDSMAPDSGTVQQQPAPVEPQPDTGQ